MSFDVRHGHGIRAENIGGATSQEELVSASLNQKTMAVDFFGLKRPKQSMPEFVSRALNERGLMDEYRNRQAYQQNDYLGWINQAKRQETKQKRLARMLDELAAGGVYMGRQHPASSK